MPPKVKQTAAEVQAEIDADPLKIVYNPVKSNGNKGVNKNIELITPTPMIADAYNPVGSSDETP